MKPEYESLTRQLVSLRRDEAAIVSKIRKALTLAELFDMIETNGIIERIKIMGVSKQHYYNMRAGIARPSPDLAAHLSRLTGVSVDTIRELQ